MNEIEPESGGISRRTVTTAMAWAVPAIALAAPSPAFAGSPGIVSFIGGGCKLPGNSNDLLKGYAFGVKITNTFAQPLEITFLSFSRGTTIFPSGTIVVQNNVLLPAAPPLPQRCAIDVNPITGIPTGVHNVSLFTSDWDNSANGLLTVTYTYRGIPPVTDPATPSNPPLTQATTTVQLSGDTWNSGCRPLNPYNCPALPVPA